LSFLAVFLAGVAFQGQVHPLLQVDVASSDEVSFCAVAPLPKLGYQDLELLEVGLKALPKGSDIFSPATIRQVTEGRGIDCRLLGDSVLISFSVNKANVQSGVDLLASLLMSPALEEDDLNSGLAALSAGDGSYWSIGMNPVKFDIKEAPRDDVVSVIQRVFDPATVEVAFGGAAVAADMQKSWSFQTQSWTSAPPPHLPDDSLPTVSTQTPGQVTIAELVGESTKSPDPHFASRLLALYAFGWGKRSSLFRIARDQYGWSYRQEAYLQPVRGGWQTRIFIPMIPTADAASRLATIAKELDGDIETWTEPDRLRALGMAEANLLRFLPYGPLLLGFRPMTSAAEDQVSMGAYWHMKTGADWDPQLMLQQMSKVSLDDLKAAAHSILSTSHPLILPAAG
jgi:hypothetical protein